MCFAFAQTLSTLHAAKIRSVAGLRTLGPSDDTDAGDVLFSVQSCVFFSTNTYRLRITPYHFVSWSYRSDTG